MKLRGVWGNAMKFVGVAVLLCGVVLWTVNTGAGKRDLVGGNKGRTAEVSRASKPATAQETQRWAAAYSKLPMSFEENQGQTAREVRYAARGGGYELFLTSQEAVMALRSPEKLDFSPRHRSAYLRAIRDMRRAGQTKPLTAIRLHFEGANPEPQISGADRLPTRVNYFTGSDPKNWHTDIPAYSRVKYSGVYPGVDLVFYGNQGHLEYDFVVAPGADPSAIQLKIDGAKKMRVNARGDLVLSVPGGEVALQKPLIYQQSNGKQREIAGNFVLADNHCVTFSVPKYDRKAPLILDPILNYSTYLGGSGIENQSQPTGIAVDNAGDAFVAGQTFSVDFPAGTNAGLVANPNPNLGASYVAELNPTGTQLLYSSYLIGSTTTPSDGATSVAVDSSGKVYVTGITAAPGFPSKNALPYSADTTNGTGFVTKLDPTQSGAGALLFSTYIGGTTGMDLPNGIAVDGSENIYIAGQTFSTDYPVMNAYQTTFNAGNANNAAGSAFLSKISSSFALVYSTYLSGNAADATSTLNGAPDYGDQAFGVAVDVSNNAYVAGTTSANNATGFPSSTNANQTAPPAGNVSGSAFVTKIDTAGSGATSLVYSTYIAGSTLDEGFAIALGPNNLAYITGAASSNDFPFTTGAFDTANDGAGKAFVTVVDTTNMVANGPFNYSTPLGGGGATNTGYGIAVDSAGNAYIVGTTTSPIFPGTNSGTKLGGFQTTIPNTNGSPFLAKLSPGGKGTADLLYSTYFGGSADAANDTDQGWGIAIDSANPPNAYIIGQTHAANMPVFPTAAPTAFQTTLDGPSDGFIAKLSLIPTLVVSPTSLSFGTVQIGTATPPTMSVTLTNNTGAAIAFTSAVISGGSPAAANNDYTVSADTCTGGVPTGASPANECTVTVKFNPSVVGSETANLVLTDADSTSPQTIALTGTGSNSVPTASLAPNPVNFNPQMVTTTSAATPVTLTNGGTGPLTINSIAASGDFAETSTGATACPISPNTLSNVAPGNTCTINVTFTPTMTGARNGNLTITDNANGSPQVVPLTGTGWDFTVTATSPQSGKSPLTFNATLTSLGGFDQAVAFTCTGAPTGTTCTVPASVTGNATTPQSVLVTVTRTGSGLLAPPAPMRIPPPSPRQIVPLVLALLLLFLLPKTKRLRVRLGMITAMILLVFVAGCSGPGTSVTPITGNITITGKSTGTAGSVTHSSPSIAITVD